MKEILKYVQELDRFFNYYVAKINNNGSGVVLVSQSERDRAIALITRLNEELCNISPTLFAELTDVRTHLFIAQGPELYSLNPYRFSALGVVLRYLKSDEFASDSAKFVHTPWPEVNNAIKKLLIDANSVSTRIDYNQVGVAAREIFILLAQKTFTPEVRNAAGEKRIGTADAKGMLEAFFEYKSTDSDVKRYAKETIKLAEHLTHIKSENDETMRTLVMAVICLAGVVNAVYQSE